MKRPGRWRRRVAPLPLQAVYTLAELARASALSRYRLFGLLERLGIRMMRSGTLILVPLSELEEKAWPFWESIQIAERLRSRTYE
jgi:hypothetical protein